MPKHLYSSAHDWLNSKINILEAGGDAKELAGMFRSFLAGGEVCNDDIQNVFESDMTDDGFFYDLESDPIDEADPGALSISDCHWFINFRLGVDPNTIDDVADDDIEGWQAKVAALIDDHDEEHDHEWGPVELSRMTGNPHRKCQVPGCNEVSLDLDDEDD